MNEPIEEYPIHPVLDDLIQNYKAFSHVEFPRGIPQPVAQWKPLLQPLTKYEAACIQEVHHYLCGKTAEVAKAQCPQDLKKSIQSFITTDNDKRDYVNKLSDYLKQIENLNFLLEDCVEELGNPCSQFRTDDHHQKG